MNPTNMLGIDLGASNGRVVWGQWTAEGLRTQGIYRFVNKPMMVNGLLCWDIKSLFEEVKAGIRRCAQEGLSFDSVGLCSWGNTIGILDDEDKLLLTPIHYRETASNAALPDIYAKYSRHRQYKQTLFQPMTIQPTVVLNYLMAKQPELTSQIRTVLMISDLFNRMLCSTSASERTMAATSQMLDMRNSAWNQEYMRGLGINPDWFPELVDNATPLAPLSGETLIELGLERPPLVIAVAGHDTASAAGCVPMERLEDSLYLSCGTWACMGCRVEKALDSDALYDSGATNDLGLYGQHHLRFNHTGLWLLQECHRIWNENGKKISYDRMMELAEQAKPFLACINTEDELFFLRGNIPQKVRDFCMRTEQSIPESKGEIVRVILESLAFRYRYSSDVLSALTGLRFSGLCLISGGAKNELLCQMTADVLHMKVTAKLPEAATIGNFMQQGIAANVLKDYPEALEIIGSNYPAAEYLPEDAAIWEDHYQKARELFGWKEIESLGERV